MHSRRVVASRRLCFAVAARWAAKLAIEEGTP
jgi:hypothetical protein